MAEVKELEEWTVAHANFNSSGIVDLESITGEVAIRPGERIELNLQLTLSKPSEFSAYALLFSFNPCMVISHLTLDGMESEFTFEQGLLTIPCNSDPFKLNQNSVLSIESAGKPNLSFGYLERSLTISAKSAWLPT